MSELDSQLILKINGENVDCDSYHEDTDYRHLTTRIEIECDATPNPKLRDLIEDWHERNIDGELRAAAEELERVIEDG